MPSIEIEKVYLFPKTCKTGQVLHLAVLTLKRSFLQWAKEVLHVNWDPPPDFLLVMHPWDCCLPGASLETSKSIVFYESSEAGVPN